MSRSRPAARRHAGRGRAARRPTLRLVAIGAVLAAAAALLATNALAAPSSGTASYRTATVSMGSVRQTLARSGTIEPVAQATIGFPLAGTVATVSVQPGDAVQTGQTLATVDTSSLQSDLAAKQATLAAARLTLSNALQSAATATASTTSTTGASSSSPSPSTRGGAPTQTQVYAALADAATAVQQATSTCTNATTDCATAQKDALAALQSALDAESSLAQAANASTSSGGGGGGGGGANSSSAVSAQTSRASSTVAPSAADLVADQAAVDAAAANVTAAEQALAQGTIVSPINGTVAAVNLTAGQQVSAASSTANVVVVGPGGYEVSTTVAVADIGEVKLGDPATVAPDGAGAALDGQVVALGASPGTSGTTTTYPVVIGLTGAPSGLRNGASAAVTITVAHATQVVTVPTSAVRTAGGLTFVSVLSGGRTTVTPVQVGAVGPDLTEVTSGLQAGQVVVLADLSQAIPSSTSTNGRFGGGFGGTGGFGGGGAVRIVAGG